MTHTRAVLLSVLAGAATACGGKPLPLAPAQQLSTPPKIDAPLAPTAWPALQSGFERLGITYSPAIETQLLDPANETDLPARFQLHGEWHDVGLRMRGQGARFAPKHSWKTKHLSGDLVDGQKTRNYLAEYIDGGYLSDPFSYALMLGATGLSPATRIVAMDVNGGSQGVYVEAQQVDKYFLAAYGLDASDNVYRCGARDCEMTLWPLESYQYPWEMHTNVTPPPWGDLDQFLYELNRTPEHEFPAWLESHVDVPRFIRFYAVAILVSFSGIDDSGSYLIHDMPSGKWVFVPWDLNNSEIVFWFGNGATANPTTKYVIPTYTLYDPATLGVAAGKSARYNVVAHAPYVVLFQRIWDTPALRNRILDEVEGMLGGVFSPAQANPRIDALHAIVDSIVPTDPWMDATRLPYHANSASYLKTYVQWRTDFLHTQIPIERHRGETGLVVNAIGPGFVELYNRDATPRDLTGLTLTTNLRQRTQSPAPALTVPPHAKVTVPLATSDGGGEVGVFDGTTLMPMAAPQFYAPLQGRTYARQPDGSDAWGWR